MESENTAEMKENLKMLVEVIPEIIGSALFDINGNLITSYSLEESFNFSELAFDASIQYLAASLLLETFDSGEFQLITIISKIGDKFSSIEKAILFVRVDNNRYLVYICEGSLKLGLLFLDSKRVVNKIMKIPYFMPERKKNLNQQLNRIEREIISPRKFLVCYVNEDIKSFQIDLFLEKMQYYNEGIKIQTLKDNVLSLDDLADWCDVFIWFHSTESEKSESIYSLLKKTDMLGKKIVSITTNFNTLPPIAATKWALSYITNIEELVLKIADDLKNYDINKPKGEWDVFQ
ncbi:MAG: hypothetical protein EU530_01125 [Promethearchaeota archaeon]|nr:MAG: hypothetical protein EU530_01125 [Candidatus Lokiarchaeota archaeon]